MQSRRYIFIIISSCVFICTILFTLPAYAHRPLTTQSAYPEKVHKVKLETGLRFLNYPEGDEAYSIDIEANYGVINNLAIGVEITYVFWRPSQSDKKADTVGDMILKSRLLFLKGREGNPISLRYSHSLKYPPENDKAVLESGFSTGKTDFGFYL